MKHWKVGTAWNRTQGVFEMELARAKPGQSERMHERSMQPVAR